MCKKFAVLFCILLMTFVVHSTVFATELGYNVGGCCTPPVVEEVVGGCCAPVIIDEMDDCCTPIITVTSVCEMEILEYFQQLFPDRTIIAITEMPFDETLIPSEFLGAFRTRRTHCGFGHHRIEQRHQRTQYCHHGWGMPRSVCIRQAMWSVVICLGCGGYVSVSLFYVDLGHPISGFGMCHMGCGFGMARIEE